MKANGVEWVNEFVFSKFDLDGNGGLDMKEFIPFTKDEQMMSRFYMVNREGDDFITLEEMLAFWEKCNCVPGILRDG